MSKEGMQTIAMLAELSTGVEGGGVFGCDGDVPVEKMEGKDYVCGGLETARLAPYNRTSGITCVC